MQYEAVESLDPGRPTTTRRPIPQHLKPPQKLYPQLHQGTAPTPITAAFGTGDKTAVFILKLKKTAVLRVT